MALGKGDRALVEQLLEDVAVALEARREETELTEFPRGLVSYVPRGTRGIPPSEEEDALHNRRRLVLRLADLAPVPAGERGALLQELEEARQALARGERTRAKELIDRAHRRVEEASERSRPSA